MEPHVDGGEREHETGLGDGKVGRERVSGRRKRWKSLAGGEFRTHRELQ